MRRRGGGNGGGAPSAGLVNAHLLRTAHSAQNDDDGGPGFFSHTDSMTRLPHSGWKKKKSTHTHSNPGGGNHENYSSLISDMLLSIVSRNTILYAGFINRTGCTCTFWLFSE